MNWKLKSQIVWKFGTQADFAVKVKKAQSFVSEVVRGRRKLSLDEKRKWGKILSCEPEKIFGE